MLAQYYIAASLYTIFTEFCRGSDLGCPYGSYMLLYFVFYVQFVLVPLTLDWIWSTMDHLRQKLHGPSPAIALILLTFVWRWNQREKRKLRGLYFQVRQIIKLTNGRDDVIVNFILCIQQGEKLIYMDCVPWKHKSLWLLSTMMVLKWNVAFKSKILVRKFQICNCKDINVWPSF